MVILKHLIGPFLILITLPIQAQSLISGSVIGRHIFGLAKDYQGDPVMLDGKPLIYKDSEYSLDLALGDTKFTVSAFSDDISSIYLTSLNNKTGNPIDTSALNLAAVEGLTRISHPVKTNWNSVLISEIHPGNTAKPERFETQFSPFFKGKRALVNPYNYGWVSEIVVLDQHGGAKIIKNYALGRLSAAQVILMPDARTMYLLDRFGNLYLFIADQANSLSKGELYAVSRDQENRSKIRYELLGKQSALKIKFKLKKAKFDAIFKSAKPKNDTCKKPFRYVNALFTPECLQLRKRYKKYAAYFEPLRYRAIKNISPFVAKDSRMSYDKVKQHFQFELSNGSRLYLPVTQSKRFNSQYIIKEQI